MNTGSKLLLFTQQYIVLHKGSLSLLTFSLSLSVIDYFLSIVINFLLLFLTIINFISLSLITGGL